MATKNWQLICRLSVGMWVCAHLCLTETKSETCERGSIFYLYWNSIFVTLQAFPTWALLSKNKWRNVLVFYLICFSLYLNGSLTSNDNCCFTHPKESNEFISTCFMMVPCADSDIILSHSRWPQRKTWPVGRHLWIPAKGRPLSNAPVRVTQHQMAISQRNKPLQSVFLWLELLSTSEAGALSSCHSRVPRRCDAGWIGRAGTDLLLFLFSVKTSFEQGFNQSSAAAMIESVDYCFQRLKSNIQ